MKRHWLIAILALLVLAPLAAEDAATVSLEQAIQSAKDNNISLETARVTLNMAIRNQNAVSTTFMPTISANVGLSTGGAFPGTNASSYGITGGLTEPAFTGLTVSAAVNASFTFSGNMITDQKSRDLQKESASLSYQSTWNTLEESITAAYWNIAAQDAAIEDAELSLQDAITQYESAKEMFDNGLLDELSLLQLELGKQSAEINVQALKDNKEIMASAFRSITGIEGDFSVEPFPGVTELSLPAAEDLFIEYNESTIQIQKARNSLRISENDKDTAMLSTYVPSLTASVGYAYAGSGYQYYKGNWTDYSNSNNSLTGSVTMTIPISSMLPGSSSSMAIKDAEDAITIASLSLQNEKDSLLEDIREYKTTIEQYQNTLLLQEASLKTAERTYALAQEAYDSGLKTADDLSSARNDLFSAQLSLLSTELSHLQACYSLAYALNMDISQLNENYAISKETI